MFHEQILNTSVMQQNGQLATNNVRRGTLLLCNRFRTQENSRTYNMTMGTKCDDTEDTKDTSGTTLGTPTNRPKTENTIEAEISTNIYAQQILRTAPNRGTNMKLSEVQASFRNNENKGAMPDNQQKAEPLTTTPCQEQQRREKAAIPVRNRRETQKSTGVGEVKNEKETNRWTEIVRKGEDQKEMNRVTVVALEVTIKQLTGTTTTKTEVQMSRGQMNLETKGGKREQEHLNFPPDYSTVMRGEIFLKSEQLVNPRYSYIWLYNLTTENPKDTFVHMEKYFGEHLRIPLILPMTLEELESRMAATDNCRDYGSVWSTKRRLSLILQLRYPLNPVAHQSHSDGTSYPLNDRDYDTITDEEGNAIDTQRPPIWFFSRHECTLSRLRTTGLSEKGYYGAQSMVAQPSLIGEETQGDFDVLFYVAGLSRITAGCLSGATAAIMAWIRREMTCRGEELMEQAADSMISIIWKPVDVPKPKAARPKSKKEATPNPNTQAMKGPSPHPPPTTENRDTVSKWIGEVSVLNNSESITLRHGEQASHSHRTAMIDFLPALMHDIMFPPGTSKSTQIHPNDWLRATVLTQKHVGNPSSANPQARQALCDVADKRRMYPIILGNTSEHPNLSWIFAILIQLGIPEKAILGLTYGIKSDLAQETYVPDKFMSKWQKEHVVIIIIGELRVAQSILTHSRLIVSNMEVIARYKNITIESTDTLPLLSKSEAIDLRLHSRVSLQMVQAKARRMHMDLHTCNLVSNEFVGNNDSYECNSESDQQSDQQSTFTAQYEEQGRTHSYGPTHSQRQKGNYSDSRKESGVKSREQLGEELAQLLEEMREYGSDFVSDTLGQIPEARGEDAKRMHSHRGNMESRRPQGEDREGGNGRNEEEERRTQESERRRREEERCKQELRKKISEKKRIESERVEEKRQRVEEIRREQERKEELEERRRRETERKEAREREEEMERRKLAQQAQHQEDEREQEMHSMWCEHVAEIESQRRYNKELEKLSIAELQEKLGEMGAGEDDSVEARGNDGEGSEVSSIGMEQDEIVHLDQTREMTITNAKRKTEKPDKTRNSRSQVGDNEDTSESSAGDRSNRSEWHMAKMVKKKKDDHMHRGELQTQSCEDAPPCHLTDITEDGTTAHGRSMIGDDNGATPSPFDMRKWAQQGRRRGDKKANTTQQFILSEINPLPTENPYDPLRGDQEENDEGEGGNSSTLVEQE
jgi:hypothetical protein